jgi:hypothetical protein
MKMRRVLVLVGFLTIGTFTPAVAQLAAPLSPSGITPPSMTSGGSPPMLLAPVSPPPATPPVPSPPLTGATSTPTTGAATPPPPRVSDPTQPNSRADDVRGLLPAARGTP